MQRNSVVEGTSASSKQLQGFRKVGKPKLKSGEFGQNMPRESSGSLGRTSSGMERLSSQPFLNDEQRAALDAALAAKQTGKDVTPPAQLRSTNSGSASVRSSGGSSAAANSDAASKAAIKAVHTLRVKGEAAHDKHLSRNTKGLGKPKKGGAGGKYTWGAVLAEDQDGVAVDHNDPNYDSDEDGMPVSLQYEFAEDLAVYKLAVVDTVDEYFNSGDVKETAASMLELDHPDLHHWFVKKLVTMAMDRHDKQREMSSALLSSLYSEVIAPEQMQKGFISLVAAIDDLSLDVPTASEMLSTFIARAVIDEILPPSIVGRLPEGPDKGEKEVKRGCEARLAGRHAAEKLQRCWGCSAGSSLEETRDSIQRLLEEYKGSHDVDEADRCLRGLNVPFFHHELVKQLLLACMSCAKEQGPLLKLLQHLSTSGEVSLSQVAKVHSHLPYSEHRSTQGFMRIKRNLEDICLDNPQGVEQLDTIAAQGVREGWLEADWDAQLPSTRNSQTISSPRSVQAFKEAAAGITKEYFQSEDAEDAAASLKDLDDEDLHDVFVKQAVVLGMEYRARDRELVSRLLAHLHASLLTSEQASSGFTRLLNAAEDLVLDCPNAAHQLTLFLARAVADGVLPASFLQSVLPSLSDTSLGVSVVQSAGNILAQHGAGDKLRKCWGVGIRRNTEQLQAQMQEIVDEYVASGNRERAQRSLLELGVPAYHHEFINLVYNTACANDNAAPRLITLLDLLAASGTVSQTQMRKGFERIQGELGSLPAECRDSTTAESCLATLKQHASTHGWLPVEAS